MYREIRLNSKPISVHKAVISPNFNSKTVIVSDTWEYVSLWLRRKHNKDASYFWDQAKSFYHASTLLPSTSSPLTSYYFMLNATKALLLAKSKTFSEAHGVSGDRQEGRLSLRNEIVKFKNSGVLSALCSYFSEPADDSEYSLKALLYNLPFIHRSFCLTSPSMKELFIPINNPVFVRKSRSKESWFCFELLDQYATDRILTCLPDYFEKELGVTDKFIVRYKKRFKWKYDKKASTENIENLTRYHRKIRRHVHYINSQQKLWYVKKQYDIPDIVTRHLMTIMFAAMHRMSEIARYSPDLLSRHLDSQHNWLLSEFILRANGQYLDEISSEVTGMEAMVPGYISKSPA